MESTLHSRPIQSEINQGTKQTHLRQQGLENTKKMKQGDLITALDDAVKEAQKRKGSPVKVALEKKVFQPRLVVKSKSNFVTERPMKPKWKWDRGVEALPNTTFA